MSRPYNPKYDSVLGPMREPSPPPSSENPFSHDASFLSQLDPSRVDVADTEAALTHLFGDVVNQAQQDDHTTSQAEDGVNKQEMQIGLTDHQLQAEQSTPTLANQEVTTTESLPLSTPEGGESDANHILIDPSLADSETGSAEPTSLPGVPVKRKATSRANMLARGGACEFCKKRKLKCSAEVPSCSNCSKVGKECVYSQKKQRSRVRVLEDRLQELEKRLDPKNTTSNTANESPIQQVNITSNNNSTTNGNTDSTYDPTDYPTLSTFEFDHHLEDPSNANPVGVDLGLEPDLMTLADAAAADTSVEYQSWQGLSPELIVGEIIKAVSGGSVPGSDGKSVGEKIVSHLIQLYIGPPSLPVLHPAVSPTTLLSRLTNRHRPIHPSLLLSLIPFLLPLSPSQILHSPSIPLLIQTHAKGLISNAITNSDPRIIDIIAACTIRAYGFYEQARYFEGWTESASATSMVYAAGLHKLGRVGEKFISQVNIEGRTERVDREKKLRVILGKGVAVSPPIDRVELGERINLL
uniref:Zn(2)-C6 fungal-type domain-containing protein n=1 Tax=Kwoniella pini CBS 10737 TaxID=1296096 RepID=A0A1B9I1U7_9TREE|nr:uncharacterized protein I206_04025 [Kwoniella pini CBS 10737]OCF49504.1 hypothetical protein I206_04025 [Kwoniella pini CBS 10737]